MPDIPYYYIEKSLPNLSLELFFNHSLSLMKQIIKEKRHAP
jgi:hypothetical protein